MFITVTRLVTIILFASSVQLVNSAKTPRDPRWPPPGLCDFYGMQTANCTLPFDEVMAFNNADTVDAIPDMPNLKAYLHCMWKHIGIVDENDIYRPERWLDAIYDMNQFHQDIYLRMGKRCTNRIKDIREKLFTVMKCYHKNDPEYGCILFIHPETGKCAY